MASSSQTIPHASAIMYQSSSCAERAHYRLTLECLRLHLLLVEGYEMQAWGQNDESNLAILHMLMLSCLLQHQTVAKALGILKHADHIILTTHCPSYL